MWHPAERLTDAHPLRGCSETAVRSRYAPPNLLSNVPVIVSFRALNLLARLWYRKCGYLTREAKKTG
jgi:hypothetical protein